MPDQYWENLKEIFHAALALAPQERAAYIEQASDGDVSLRKAVESLLKSHEQANNFVDAPAYQAAAEMLTDGREFGTGRLVAHYRIVSLLGEGGMGRVYLAEDTKLYRKVSLKFLSTNFTQDHERLRRFEQEARAASALNHPNILTIHEIGEADGWRFIATEFIEGQTLRELLPSGIEIHNALEIAEQVASALVAAHRVNIIHRDIKPENIMVRHDDGLVKVLDFGLAKMSLPRSARAEIDSEAETRMRAAAEVANRDPQAAAKMYDDIAADRSIGAAEQDLARIRAAGLLLETASYPSMRERLEAATKPDATFRHTARELLALSAWRANDTTAARQWLDMIANDGETPSGLRSRAEALQALLPPVAKS